jgi:hypothetical protein
MTYMAFFSSGEIFVTVAWDLAFAGLGIWAQRRSSTKAERTFSSWHELPRFHRHGRVGISSCRGAGRTVQRLCKTSSGTSLGPRLLAALTHEQIHTLLDVAAEAGHLAAMDDPLRAVDLDLADTETV